MIYDLHSHWGTEKAYPLRGKAQQAKQVDIWKTECQFVTPPEMADYFRKNDVKAMLDGKFQQQIMKNGSAFQGIFMKIAQLKKKVMSGDESAVIQLK
jgi:hypothetical protein